MLKDLPDDELAEVIIFAERFLCAGVMQDFLEFGFSKSDIKITLKNYPPKESRKGYVELRVSPRLVPILIEYGFRKRHKLRDRSENLTILNDGTIKTETGGDFFKGKHVIADFLYDTVFNLAEARENKSVSVKIQIRREAEKMLVLPVAIREIYVHHNGAAREYILTFKFPNAKIEIRAGTIDKFILKANGIRAVAALFTSKKTSFKGDYLGDAVEGFINVGSFKVQVRGATKDETINKLKKELRKLKALFPRD